MNVNKFAAAIALTSLIAACSLTGDDGMFRDRGENYRDAKTQAPLKLPSDQPGESVPVKADAEFAISGDEGSYSETEYEVPRPAPLNNALRQAAVKINSLGQLRWVSVADAPGIVWPKIKGFLNYNGIEVANTDAARGIVETAWLKPAANEEVARPLPSPDQERYRFVVSRGVQANTSEIVVLQMDNERRNWPTQSDDLERENIMIQALAQFLVDSAELAPVTLMAQRNMSSEPRVYLEGENSASPYLRLDLPQLRAWAAVEKSLEKSNFSVTEKDYEDGFFLANWTALEPQKKSFWGKLFSGSKSEAKSYMILMKKVSADRSIIVLQDANSGKPLAADESLQLLKLIQNNLS